MTEYGIARDDEPTTLHRGPMSLYDAKRWIAEWDEDLGKPGVFIIISREVTPWGPTT